MTVQDKPQYINELEVEVVDIESLVPDPNNNLTHTEVDLEPIAESLRQFGQRTPIVVNRKTRMIAKGNGTWQAAKDYLRWQKIGVVYIDDDATTQAAYSVADNLTGRRADWNWPNLNTIVGSVDNPQNIPGMTAEFLQTIKDNAPEAENGNGSGGEGSGGEAAPQLDRADELLEQWGVKPGQVWQLGAHVLMCGDSTDPAAVKGLGIESGMAAFVDPPYGIDYESEGWIGSGGTHDQSIASKRLVANDDGNLDLSFLKAHDRRLVWGFPHINDEAAEGWLVWDKEPQAEQRGVGNPVEMAYTTLWRGFDIVRALWKGYYRVDGEERQPHPTQKPTAVFLRFIEKYTESGEVIADYFGGSGTVMIAAEMIGRRCFTMEIEPAFVAVTLQRWEDETGQEPRLIGC